MKFILILLLLVTTASAHDDKEHWHNLTPEMKAWYESLKQPTNPTMSCCGLADAYWADEVKVLPDGRVEVTITDDRPDKPLGRPNRPPGTKVIIPKQNMVDFSKPPNEGKGNPTGHGVLFISVSGVVYCYVTGTLT